LVGADTVDGVETFGVGRGRTGHDEVEDEGKGQAGEDESKCEVGHGEEPFSRD